MTNVDVKINGINEQYAQIRIALLDLCEEADRVNVARADAEATVDALRKQFLDFAGFTATVRRNNTDEWMVYCHKKLAEVAVLFDEDASIELIGGDYFVVSSKKDKAAEYPKTESGKPKKHPYGFCPHCGHEGVSRERRPHGNDKCKDGHVYPSSASVATMPSNEELAS